MLNLPDARDNSVMTNNSDTASDAGHLRTMQISVSRFRTSPGITVAAPDLVLEDGVRLQALADRTHR